MLDECCTVYLVQQIQNDRILRMSHLISSIVNRHFALHDF